MVLNKKFLFILAAFSGMVSAQTTLTGSVVDTLNNGISGVKVELLDAGLSSFTNSLGEWSITVPSTGIPAPDPLRPGISAEFTKGKLSFQVAGQSERVQVGVYTLKGQLAFPVIDRILTRGSYVCNPFIRSLPAEPFVIRLQIGGAAAMFEAPSFGRSVPSGPPLLKSSADEILLKAAKLSDAVDTLRASKAGYFQVDTAILSYDGSCQITLRKNPDISSGEVVITADSFWDKVRGSLTAELIGNFSGMPTELSFRETPNPNEVNFIYRSPTWGADDDTRTQYVLLHIMEEHGLDATTYEDMVPEWLDHLNDNGIYCGTAEARNNMRSGLIPPATGSEKNNWWWNSLDAMIASEFIGLVSPGMPVNARGRESFWARAVADGRGVDGAAFVSTMVANAFFANDMQEIVHRTREVFPDTCYISTVVDSVIKWHGMYDTWEEARVPLTENFWTNSTENDAPIAASVNLAAMVLSLLYANNDFYTAMQIALRAGWDNDCNAAMIGAIIGAYFGYSGIPEEYTSQCGNGYAPQANGLPDYESLADMASRIQALAEENISARGGSITGTGAEKTYRIVDAPFGNYLIQAN